MVLEIHCVESIYPQYSGVLETCLALGYWFLRCLAAKVLNQFYGANLTLDSDVDQDTFGKVTKHNTHHSQEISPFPAGDRPQGYKEQTRHYNTHEHEAN